MLTVSASAETFTVNGKTFPNYSFTANGSNPYCTDGIAVGSGTHSCCWIYAYWAYRYIWDETFARTTLANDMLRNLSTSDRTVTEEHLKAYFASAEPGAIVRFTNNATEAASPHTTGDSSGHSLIFLGVDSSDEGAYFLEGNYDGHGRSRIALRTWSSLVSKYKYIKYIMWPDATEYSATVSTEITISGENEPSSITTGASFSISGTIKSGAKITKVVAGVYDYNGNVQISASATPNSTSFNLLDIDDDLAFGKLSPGVYRYKVTATNSAGTTTLIDSVFTVLSKSKTVSSGNYVIQFSKNTKYCASIADNSLSSGANLQLGKVASGIDALNQTFHIQYVSNGWYTIENYESEKYLSVYNSGTKSKTNVTQSNYTGNSNQLWQILPCGDSYCLVPKCAPSMCLAVQGSSASSGTNIYIYRSSLGNAQKFTLARKVIKTYTVKYSGHGATSGTMKSETKVCGITYALTANAYKRTGYTFAGWNTKKDGSGTAYKDEASVKNLTSTNGETVTLYAQWTANTYTVKFNGNGATSGTMKSSTKTYGKTYTLTANAYERTGYTFAGWNTKADGSGTSYADQASIKNLAKTNGKTVKLYAQWTANTYKIKYDGNGATSGSMKSKSIAYDTAYTLTANAYELPGYTFAGWNTEKDGSGTAYEDEASIKNLTSTDGQTVKLYAQWISKVTLY
jgi:uncharacterized repeat protein (TIGR02543 family)